VSDIVVKPSEVEKWALGSHVGVESRLLVDGDHITVLLSHWGPGATAPEHVHPHEQVGICLQGHVIVTVRGKDHPVGPGEFYHIPGSVPHAERNEGEDVVVLADFFSPIREDLVRRQFEARVVR
jgi:quercetin dioxygenase-like cupin family protein